MNEFLFFIHILVVLAFSYLAFKGGKVGLITWMTLQAIFANLFVLKQIVLFSFHVPCSDVFAVGSILSLNLLQEFHGTESRKEAIKICFFSLIFFNVLSQLHLFYVPSPEDLTDPAYQAILSHSPRILLASMGVFFITQQIDTAFFTFLKKRKLPLLIRNGCALFLSQFLDTALFTLVGLAGLIASITDTILLSFSLKVLIIAVLSFCLSSTKKVWLREV